jgi:hypothetical protein
MTTKFNVGDSVALKKETGKVVGFNGRGWPIVEWQNNNNVLVEDPENITLILEEN